MLGTLGEKVGMTQYFKESGAAVGATVIKSEPAVVVQVKTLEKDGYNGVQLGYKDTEKRKLTKPMKGHFDKYGVQPKKYLVEYRVDNPEDYDSGDEITVEQFQSGNEVDVTGNSKGKGFQGVVKRWNFSGGPKTHGSRFHRKPGSVGMCVEPGRVLKGQKLPGRTGNETVTIQNLEVLKASPEDNLLVLKGSVPGPRDNLIQIRGSND
ncbi:50S ribosomal protein L3 [Candidatus Bipolaricaulota bacterium]|nr:50S ribosomal protein L3 [Candidatus Bipolaricaulota bacterium]